MRKSLRAYREGARGEERKEREGGQERCSRVNIMERGGEGEETRE